jgi:superfamily II DNA helicase RecQ
MDDKEKLKDRLVELRQLVDEEESEDDGIKNVVSDFGRAPLGCELRPFQIEGASYLVNGEPGKVLAMIIQPGLGKSLSYIIHHCGCLHRGITLVFQPTLTLGADQFSKLNLLSEKANLKAYNLHDYKIPESWNPLVKELKALSDCPIHAVPRVFLMVSPECVTDEEKPWAQLFLELATVNLIRLLVVDEFHLWRQRQGVTFRPDMNKTGKKIIAEITKVSPLTSVVFFTATSQLLDIAVLESICGVRVRRIILGSPREMQKRCVKIEMACRSQYLTVAKPIVAEVVAKADKKFIVYADFTTDVENIAHSLREMASEMKKEVDFLEITGSDPSEQKALNIDVFCENVMEPDEKALLKLYRGLVATSGVASTGIDPPPNLEHVSRKGLPPSASTAFQEIGRLQRGDAAPNGVYLYHIMANVDSYAKLLLRTEMSENAKQDEKDRNFDDQFQVLKMLVLDDVCLHFAFETMFGRPGSSDTLDASCGAMCPVCSGNRNAQCAPFYVQALQRSLAKIFLKSATVNLRDSFVSKLKEVSLKEGVWAYVKDATSTRTSIDTYKVEMLILQLLAAKIIECVFKVSKFNGKEGEAETEVHVCGVANDAGTGYRFSEIDAFKGIPKARLDEPPASAAVSNST